VHPVHVEAVANVVGRAELMAAAGYAVALVCALRAQSRPVYLIGVAAGAAFGIASKELVATLPASVLLLYAWKRADMRMGWKAAAVAAIPIGAYYVLHEWIGAGLLTSGGTAAGLERLGMVSRAWAMVPLTLQWWRLLLFPAHLSADYSPAELTVSTGLTLGHVLALCVWALAGLLAWRTRHAIPGIALGLLWLIITVAPVSNVLLPTELLIAERTLYLPSFGIVFALASIGVALPWPARVRVGLLAFVLTLGIARSVARIPAWHDDDMHFEALKREAPHSYRTLWLEGNDEFARGQWGSGERFLQAAITAAPVIAGPRYDLARFYMKARLWQPAIRELQAAITVDSAFTPARDALRDAEDSARQDRRRP
ncbi:MAG TPA: hypothetical protein VG454_08645, partial [Gemmatimonadales bacterium]|nr:hypothetical protein [Gemmatimonadales bacterium]